MSLPCLQSKRMKSFFYLLTPLGLLLLSSCGSSSFSSGAIQHPTNTGPFDSRGNYIEAWADRPDKWNRKTHVPPPVRQSPALPTLSRKETPRPVSTPPARNTPPPSRKVAQSPPPRPQSATSAPKPKPQAAAPKPAPKPAAKPQPTRYVVKSGDNLSKIAARHGSSVTAIQRANGIRGTMIHPGQRLTIPR
jgi:LysM repeat protein